MFKEDIKIKILNEEHFKKVKEILVKESYFFSCGIRYPVNYLFARNETQDVGWRNDSDYFDKHENKEYVLHNSALIPKEQVNKLLTPCEQLGYKVGDKFVVIRETAGFTKDQIINLYKDDGSHMPLFKGENSRYASCSGESGAYLDLSYAKPFKESNTKEEKKMTEVNQQKVANKEPKNKPKTQAQLVFTYTNGKRYVVRGLQRVDVSLADYGGNSFVNYTNQTKNDIKTQLSDVSVRVTNELVKVEKINTDNSVEVILDLSSAAAKAQEGAKKPRGNARSKEQWEAMVEAKKSQEERNKALVEATAKQLAEKMLKEGKI